MDRLFDVYYSMVSLIIFGEIVIKSIADHWLIAFLYIYVPARWVNRCDMEKLYSCDAYRLGYQSTLDIWLYSFHFFEYYECFETFRAYGYFSIHLYLTY